MRSLARKYKLQSRKDIITENSLSIEATRTLDRGTVQISMIGNLSPP